MVEVLVVMALELPQPTDMVHIAENKEPTSFWGGFFEFDFYFRYDTLNIVNPYLPGPIPLWIFPNSCSVIFLYSFQPLPSIQKLIFQLDPHRQYQNTFRKSLLLESIYVYALFFLFLSFCFQLAASSLSSVPSFLLVLLNVLRPFCVPSLLHHL